VYLSALTASRTSTRCRMNCEGYESGGAVVAHLLEDASAVAAPAPDPTAGIHLAE
jgi:hypothetical protein